MKVDYSKILFNISCLDSMISLCHKNYKTNFDAIENY